MDEYKQILHKTAVGEAYAPVGPRKMELLGPKKLPEGAVTEEEYNRMEPHKKRYYLNQQRQQINHLDTERERLLAHMEDISDEDSKNRTWENNHRTITYCIAQSVYNYGRMPTQNEIAKQTLLSRKTVQKHLSEYHTHPLFGQHLEYFQFMGHRVMGSLLKLCMEGNVQAIKTYIDLMQKLPGAKMAMPQGNTFINNNQHNYMQVNNTVLNQQVIQQLSPEQLKQIEAIIIEGKAKE
jgi:hypothetical protein